MKQIYRATPHSAPGIGSDVLCIFLLVFCQFYAPMVLGSSMEAHLTWVHTSGPEKIAHDSHLEPTKVSSALNDQWSLKDYLRSTIPIAQANEAMLLSSPVLDTELAIFSTGPFDCTAAISVPYPNWTGSCATQSIHTLLIHGKTGQIMATIPAGASRFVSQIPVGCHTIRYTIHDTCGNSQQQETAFWVVDNIAPIAVCVEDLNLSINDAGYGQVTARDIDEGSTDNCASNLKLEIRRKYMPTSSACQVSTEAYSSWGEQVLFNCCDVGQEVIVELRVWDDANGNGVPGDVISFVRCDGVEVEWEDNSNICWMEVAIEDKTTGECIAPHDRTISCSELPYDFDPNQIALFADLFGIPQVNDNCGEGNWQELPATLALGSCMQGTITRHFQVDHEGSTDFNSSCQQTISVVPAPDYSIRFPADEAAICGLPEPDTITFQEGACDLLAVSASDEFFSASGDACYKILRTYRVINWCEYDGESPPVTVGRDEDCDGLSGDEAVWVVVKEGHTYFDANADPLDDYPSAGQKSNVCDGLTNPQGHWINNTIDEQATRDPITGQEDNDFSNDQIRTIDSRGYWEYTQHIKVYDTLAPVITVAPYPVFEILNSTTCEGEVRIEFSVEDACTEEEGLSAVFLQKFIEDIDQDGNITQGEFVQYNEITTEISGSPSKFTYTTSLPEGQHALLIKAIDGCGNTSADLVLFELVDNKAPSPICINGLAVELSPVEEGTDADADMDPDWGAASVWATDFIASPVDDCNGPVTYSINRVGEMPNPSYMGLIVTCDDPGSVVIEIHAWDSNGNNDYCETYLLIEDNLELCYPDPEGDLAGGIVTEDNFPVEQVQVRLSGPMLLEEMTNPGGEYHFNHLPQGYDYTIQPFLDRMPNEGVTTLDIIYIMQHILGERELDSPYKRIAADVDQTASITTLDIIHIRRLVLGIDDQFQHSKSWRFVDREYVFPDPANPWVESFPEVININNLTGVVEAQDFVAIKIGDVSSVIAPTIAPDLDTRSSKNFLLEAEDQKVFAGEIVLLSISSADWTQLRGVQFSLEWDPLKMKIEKLQEGIMKESHFGQRYLAEGLLTVSWNKSGEAVENHPVELFGLEITAKQDLQLSEVLQISSRLTQAEAYRQGAIPETPKLRFSPLKVAEAAEFELFQNVPNPFQGMTTIGFYLAEASSVSFELLSLSGQRLFQLERHYEKGYQEIRISEHDITARGTLLYTLTAGKHTATRKLIFYE